MIMTMETFWEKVREDIPDVTMKEVSEYYYGKWTILEAVKMVKMKRKVIIDQRKAITLLGEYTGGSFIIYNMAGPRNVKKRQEILQMLTGKKLTQSKCGVNELRKEFYAIANPEGECEAAKESNFIIWARKNLNA